MKVLPVCPFIGLALIAAGVVMPIEYYTFLRWFVSLGSIYLVYVFVKQFGWKGPTPIIHLAAAILFNPIVPFYMSRPNWVAMDVAYFFLLILTAYLYEEEVRKYKLEKGLLY